MVLLFFSYHNTMKVNILSDSQDFLNSFFNNSSKFTSTIS